jgi:hypothetical protein
MMTDKPYFRLYPLSGSALNSVRCHLSAFDLLVTISQGCVGKWGCSVYWLPWLNSPRLLQLSRKSTGRLAASIRRDMMMMI